MNIFDLKQSSLINLNENVQLLAFLSFLALQPIRNGKKIVILYRIAETIMVMFNCKPGARTFPAQCHTITT